MATSLTPRINLLKPDGSELMSLVDPQWNQNMNKIDALAGLFTCTAATHPASPYTGQRILETDTGKMLVWNGSAWIVYSTKDCAWHLSNPTTLTPPNITFYNLTGWNNQELYNCSFGANGIVLNTPGIYFVSLCMRWENRAQGSFGFVRGLFIDLIDASGSPTLMSRNNTSGNNGVGATLISHPQMVGGLFHCTAAGQRIMPRAYQESGGAFNLVNVQSFFRGCLIQPAETY